MHSDSKRAYRARSEKLNGRWRELCESYLPVRGEDSVWRFSRGPTPEDPEQGWKLHISATLLNGHKVLERVAPPLISRGVLFKAPSSLQELGNINAGIHYGYSQVGKIITVYPRTLEEAALLAPLLHGLTRYLTAPSVPFDLRFRPGSNVYYRYGAFKALEMQMPDGQRMLAIRDSQSNLIPDLREQGKEKPDWVTNPFIRRRARPKEVKSENPLSTTFCVLRALAQRGKGGVYQALDLSVEPARMCLLKEGRKGGEISWERRDGRWMVRHEQQVLAQLLERGVSVPRIYSSFELAGNYYLVTEFVDGENLERLLRRQKKRLPLRRALYYGSQLADLICKIHAAGWAWMDCKPSNLIVTKQGNLRAVDFEGACEVSKPRCASWSTPAYSPPKRSVDGSAPGVIHDLFALGAVIYLLVTGRLPDAASSPLALKSLRRNVPDELCKLLSELLGCDPLARPHISDVKQRMRAILSSVN